MDFFLWMLFALAIGIAIGVYLGITILRETWLKPGFKMGFIQDGPDAYTITRKRRNN